jgi:hypothetical protein
MPTPTKSDPIHADNLAEDLEVFYLSPPFEETEAAAAWLDTHDPKALAQDNLIPMLHLQRVSRRTAVVLLLRKPVGRKKITAAQGYLEASNTGERVTVHTPVEELAKEVQAYGPINCADYWEQGATRFSAHLNRAAFVAAIAKLATPYVIGFEDVASKKNGDLPDQLVLRTV